MKICTITCSNVDNYGARLQTYALAKYLIDQGNEVQVIDYRPSYMDPDFRIFLWPGLSLKGWVKFFLRFSDRIRAKKKHHKFLSFSRQYIPFTEIKYHNIQELRQVPPEADIYIAGSDQIWNTTFPNGTDPAFYLDFGPDSIKRESYAASFATKELRPGTEDFVRDHLRRFNSISVREKSGLRILANLGYQGIVQEDPVFLLSAAQWDKIADSSGEGERYLLVYDFFSDKRIKKTAKDLAKENKLNIFAICPTVQRYASKNYVTAGPESFISLVKNAAYVVTNSFHAIVFCTIYHRPFRFVERPDGLNERMKDFLETHQYDGLCY